MKDADRRCRMEGGSIACPSRAQQFGPSEREQRGGRVRGYFGSVSGGLPCQRPGTKLYCNGLIESPVCHACMMQANDGEAADVSAMQQLYKMIDHDPSWDFRQRIAKATATRGHCNVSSITCRNHYHYHPLRASLCRQRHHHA